MITGNTNGPARCIPWRFHGSTMPQRCLIHSRLSRRHSLANALRESRKRLCVCSIGAPAVSLAFAFSRREPWQSKVWAGRGEAIKKLYGEVWGGFYPSATFCPRRPSSRIKHASRLLSMARCGVCDAHCPHCLALARRKTQPSSHQLRLAAWKVA